MHRGVHIAVAFLALFLLVRPFDCFSGGKFDRKAADCCKKGKCSPSNSDNCCKATVPGGGQMLTAQATDHAAPVLAILPAAVATDNPQFAATARFIEIQQPPGLPPGLRLNLPLLI